jgi:hypothetical protein
MSNAELIGWAIFVAVVLSAGYVATCTIWPWGACGRCEGGRKYAPFSRKHWRDCRKCKGTGRRVRLGRRVWTWLAARKHDAVG